MKVKSRTHPLQEFGTMTLTLSLPAETERRLRTRAEERGLTPEAFVRELLESTLAANERQAAVANVDRPDVPVSAVPLPDDDEDDTPAFWRGVFPTEHSRETLFTQDLAVPPSGLPRREPNVILNERWMDEDE
jgi:hypothetical protein